MLTVFLLAPGDIGLKTHLALHGLCAQRPSHSLHLGGNTLPLDARMSGIYIGAAVTLLWLVSAGRMRSPRVPSRAVLWVLAGFVCVLGLDGFNALLVDIGWVALYEPRNWLRLATGMLGGTALGVVLAHLFAVSMWSAGHRPQAVVSQPRELFAPLGVAGALAAAVLSGLPLLYAPAAVGLLVAAVGVWWTLATVLTALMLNRGWSSLSFRDVAPLALIALCVALCSIAALSGLRLLAEHFGGLPQLI